MPTNKGFNGSTVAFSGTLAKLVSVNHTAQGAQIDVTGASDTRHLYEVGLPNESFTVEVVGHVATAIGTKSTLTVTWYDGTTDTIANTVLAGKDVSGSLDDKIATTMTFVPSEANGS
jgi:hypothetical protein